MATRLNKYTTDRLFELLKETFSKESFYWTQRRCLMNNANASAEDDFVKPSERDEMITYILDICDREDMSLSLDTFALAVSLVDRFLSNFKVKSKYLECLSVACLYIACKIKEEDDMISVTSEFLMDCDCKCSIGELLRMEQMILIKFEWSVNDTTAVDFLYIFYGLLVNEFSSGERCDEAMKTDSELIWSNFRNTACAMFPNTRASSQPQHQGMIPTPVELDFLHTLEYKLKQVLCVQELTTTYKPHVLAYCLLKMQLESDPQLSSNKRVQDLMDSIKQMSKLPYETEDKCKEQIKYHLMTIENTKNLFDRYFKEHAAAYRLIRDYRPSASIFMPQLSAIDTKLESIREEDEEEEAERDMMLYGKAANYMDIMACSDQEAASFLSYADILAGRRRDQKRKLSSSSMSDAEIDYDNRMD